MIEYNFVGKFAVKEEEKISDWVAFVLDQEEKELGPGQCHGDSEIKDIESQHFN